MKRATTLCLTMNFHKMVFKMVLHLNCGKGVVLWSNTPAVKKTKSLVLLDLPSKLLRRLAEPL